MFCIAVEEEEETDADSLDATSNNGSKFSSTSISANDFVFLRCLIFLINANLTYILVFCFSV